MNFDLNLPKSLSISLEYDIPLGSSLLKKFIGNFISRGKIKLEDNINISSKLRNLLGNLEDWGKTNTNVPGVKIIKIPAKKDVPERLGIEINPVDSSGRPIKKTGNIVLTNLELFEMYAKLFTNQKIQELMREIELLRKELYPNDIDKQENTVFEL